MFIMETVDMFIRAVQYYLDSGATQVSIAKELGIGPQQVNAFMKKRANFSEDRKERVSAFFGKTYLEMLILGHQLLTGSELAAPDLPVNLKDVVSKLEGLDQDSLKLISALADKLPKEDK